MNYRVCEESIYSTNSELFINLFQISLLSSAVNHLKASVKSAADLLSLPSTVEGLQKVSAACGHYGHPSDRILAP